MLARPQWFDEDIRDGRPLVTRADLLSGGQPVPGYQGIPVETGTVSVDRTQLVRRTCQVTIADQALARATAAGTSPLSPFGNEIRLSRGLVMRTGEPFMLPLGTFGIRDVQVDDPAAQVVLTGKDRMQRVVEARLETALSATGFSVVAMAQQLFAKAMRFPVGPLVDPTIVDHTSGQVTWDTDRGQALIDLAASVGAEPFCDAYGNFVLRAVPALTAASVWTFDTGSGGVLVSAQRTQSRDGVYNAIMASGSAGGSTAPPTSGLDYRGFPLVRDDDPLSPTYYFGQFGAVPAFYSSPLLLTFDQCVTAARAVLRNYIGIPKTVTLTAVPHPALEEGDVITVAYSDKTRELHLIDQISWGLGAADVMTISTRSTVRSAQSVS